MKRLECLDGLRGVLAVYVLLGHMAPFSALPAWVLRPLSHGGAAVDVFFILSGMVIVRSLESCGYAARPFLIARAARIFPVYLAMLAAGVAVQTLPVSFAAMPWIGPDSAARDIWSHGWPAYWSVEIAAHLTMTHGLFPSGALPDVWVSFLGAAWSLSTEWQFYVLALLWGRARPGIGGMAAALLAMAAAGLAWDVLAPDAWRFSRAFLPNKAHYFALGVASAGLGGFRTTQVSTRLSRIGANLTGIVHSIIVTIWAGRIIRCGLAGSRREELAVRPAARIPSRGYAAPDGPIEPGRGKESGRGKERGHDKDRGRGADATMDGGMALFAAVFMAVLALCLARGGGGGKLLPPLVWAVCLAAQTRPDILKFVAVPLRARWVQYLGAISYPIYLANEPIQKVLGVVLAGWVGGDGWVFSALWVPGAVLLPIAAAALLHKSVEMPGIQRGKALARHRVATISVRS